MESYILSYKEILKKSLCKPLEKRLLELLPKIEERPMLFLGNDLNIRCLFHFLNGWQTAMIDSRDDAEASLNEKMNAFLALKYNDFRTLNWMAFLIEHEGEEHAFGKFFEYLHIVMEDR